MVGPVSFSLLSPFKPALRIEKVFYPVIEAEGEDEMRRTSNCKRYGMVQQVVLVVSSA